MKANIVVGQVKTKLGGKLKPREWFEWAKTQRELWPVFGVTAVLLVGSLGYGAYKQFWPQQNLNTTLGSLTQSASAVASKKDYDKAIALSLTARREAATKEGRYDATMSAAGWYLEKKDYKNALFYYQDAEKLMPKEDVNVYLGVAGAATGANNKDLAKKYYQKAADFYKKDQGSSTKNSDIITFLEAKTK